MNTIHALAGPPASGKTTTIHKIKHVLEIDDDMILDDVRAHPDWMELVKERVSIGNIIIADIMFSTKLHRNEVESLGFPVRWYYMEKNAGQCIINAIFRCVFMIPEHYASGGRNIDREIGFINSLSSQYFPEGECIEGPKCPDLGMLKQARAISGPLT